MRDFEARFALYFKDRPDRTRHWDTVIAAADFDSAREKCRRQLAAHLPYGADSIFGAVRDGEQYGSWEWIGTPNPNKSQIVWREDFWPDFPNRNSN
jgi:hypothetical protein